MRRVAKRAVWIGLSAVTLIAASVLWTFVLREGGSDAESPSTEAQSSAWSRLHNVTSSERDTRAPAAASIPNGDLSVRGSVADPFGSPVGIANIDVWMPTDVDGKASCRSRDAALVAQVRSHADGAFELTLPAEELFCVRARHDAWSGSEPVLVSTGEGRTESVRLVLEQSQRVNGRVIDSTSAVVANVDLALVRQDGPAVGEPKRATTDGNGRFAFTGVDSGHYILRSVSGRHVVSKPQEILVRADTPLDELQVQIDAVVSISGRVLDATGKPLRNVRIIARSPYDADLFLGSTTSDETGSFTLLSEQRSAAGRMAQRMASGQTVDKSGTEISAPLAAEGVCVEFAYADREADAVSVIAQGTAFNVGTVHLRPTHTRSGRVVDSEGKPVAAKIVFREIARAAQRESLCAALPVVREARASGDGAVSVQLKPGRYEADVQTDSQATRSLELNVGRNEEPFLLRLE